MLQRDLVPCLVSAYWVAECNVSMSYGFGVIFSSPTVLYVALDTDIQMLRVRQLPILNLY